MFLKHHIFQGTHGGHGKKELNGEERQVSGDEEQDVIDVISGHEMQQHEKFDVGADDPTAKNHHVLCDATVSFANGDCNHKSTSSLHFHFR